VIDPDDLYGLPLDRFVAERDALAKLLRAGGERGRAAEVAKLPKPSAAAWAINQLVRTQRRMVTELFASGDRLQEAQSELLVGRGDARSLREAAERERAAVDHLTDTARGLLSSEGHELSAVTLERVRETLHAAALETDARARVSEGCLVRELRHVGIGESSSARRSSAAKRTSGKEVTREQAERRKAVRKAAEDARRAAARAEHELRTAQQRRDRAADVLKEAEAALAEARRRAEEAAETRERTKRALTKPPE
jgi:hypothetical protein